MEMDLAEGVLPLSALAEVTMAAELINNTAVNNKDILFIF